MSRVSDIRKGLRDRLMTIEGLRVYATMPAAAQSPAAAVIPRSRVLHTMDGGSVYQFEVWVYVNPSDLMRAQNQIDDYLGSEGPNSIERAIEADASLDGLADSAIVTGWATYARLVDMAGGQLLGCEIDVEVFA